MAQDFVQLAATLTQESFVAEWPHPFLVGEAALYKSRHPSPLTFESGSTVTTDAETLARRDQVGRLVLPVRKTHITFPSMITVGRTKNNDIVVSDVLISKFHAFFRLVDDHHELTDAGSQNGTRIGERALVPKGPGVRVQSGDVIHFAQIRFRFLDAAACWDALRAH
jgi:FHA domain-containing protein